MKYNRYPKRDAVKNYFPLPNEIFSLGLSGGEILVYTYLMYREDRETFQCHPSYKTIGEAIGKPFDKIYILVKDKRGKSYCVNTGANVDFFKILGQQEENS